MGVSVSILLLVYRIANKAYVAREICSMHATNGEVTTVR